MMPFLQTAHDQNYSDSRVATTVTLVIYPETNPRDPPSTAPSSGNGKNLAESVNAAHWLGNSGYPLHGAERGPYCAIKSNQRRRCLAARRVSRPFVLPSLPFFRMIVFFSFTLIRFNRPTAEGNNGRILLQDIEWNKRRTVVPYARIFAKGEAVPPSSSMRLAGYRERPRT
ncbi:hypothetical protein ALC62_07973 [Cyphomyrmex costatus]|uniref:Uncharacterized protein n=1 Tax=Cyphomyrmex costatus TaxID=456900 RepID=A0A195CMP2_9HYME|nr:hypothetical protein ALC62_07973 [Cyphomyrmex costatus]